MMVSANGEGRMASFGSQAPEEKVYALCCVIGLLTISPRAGEDEGIDSETQGEQELGWLTCLPPWKPLLSIKMDGAERVTIQGAEAPPESTSTPWSDYFPSSVLKIDHTKPKITQEIKLN